MNQNGAYTTIEILHAMRKWWKTKRRSIERIKYYRRLIKMLAEQCETKRRTLRSAVVYPFPTKRKSSRIHTFA